MDTVLSEMLGNREKIYISIAAGVTVAFLESRLGSDKKIVRTMPNTPAQVGCGMTVVTPNANVTDLEQKIVLDLFNSIGNALILPEKELEIATALHGSSPAYVYMMIDAMAKSGERQGIPYETALRMAGKTVLGATKLLLSSNDSADVLIDRVCSKGGTTIEAVNHLKEHDFYKLIDDAMAECTRRALELRK